MSLFKGSAVAIITPFKSDGSVDFEKLADLIEWHIQSGTKAIVVCGTTGESSTMTVEEDKATIKFTVEKVNKRIPVIAGTGSNCTSHAVSMSQWAESIGVDGLLVITPYYNKTTQKGLIEHFKAVNTAVSTPIILYNVPSRTGLNLAPKTLEKLCDLENITAIKEASGDISQIAYMKAICRDKIDIYSGNDDQTIPILALGGVGVISVAANIVPTDMEKMCELFFKGDTEGALKIQLDLFSLIKALFIETNPIPIKTALNLLGKSVGNLRLPLCSMANGNLDILKNELKNYGLLK
ncbi:4-hydroxy-tetrahydrodipicolinate synthase [Clostridium tyrobutyricum]|jgi:4-hydroxy-tetrahydrodipicolinate synthase|uniref:4-hydroxy-tetrahydrodipicolinate synthase n=1 Tax=Clostridium tyrobutyricum DIVETGP TaxID=1408889 RepID=W6NM32_CLOTY|nr:4-hydroxy-tetrahydrodipicolinate synthase [Clostridium tyrobutyricum]AND85764.1 4-hydroxy-tetrahydrodipicolinate synthase [Clostridium tyrobutyricum]ANP70282.1 4-hydroxy-tetrahydrodipicolinate synthase [Clostridium tyrobutyricum]MBR9648310.1 4-hydroxy-tetrahydrodipicolinate synthase [Clostridium tyrobutyricum]MBV4417650.1 4-hydroxy-tetrahydrodipicolinate synthase [Clostridium tyrobutyricum]MBV4421225.1 4-hydroxy-tetrahydrodipicolinate synthase [Clostridium tyrobutyricum]